MAKTVLELQVFQRALAASDALFAILQSTRLRQARDLGAQLDRASTRVVSDIAEGFEQKTDRHFARYLYDARGGAAEIRVQLLIAQSRGLISDDEHRAVAGRYEEIGRMLTGLIRYLEQADRRDRHKKEKGEPA